MRGRKPKPTTLKLLTGNPGKRRINRREPKPPKPTDGFDTVPSELRTDVVGSKEWTRLAPMLRAARQITEAERTSLIALCQQWSRYLEANGKVGELGMVVKAPSGYPITNPYLSIANKALQQCGRLWVELGLTPSARSRISSAAEGGGRTGPDDAFAEFDEPIKPWAASDR